MCLIMKPMIACAILFTIYCRSKSEEFKFKVIAPEFICSKQNMSQTTIRLVGEDVPNLNFNWSIDFQIGKEKKMNQRQIILLWRSVRRLFYTFQNISTDDTKRGIILINNTMLTPDVVYMINITAQKKHNSSATDNRIITLEYLNEINSNLDVSANIIGPEVTYSDMIYTAEAEINSCLDNLDYQLSWQLMDKSKKMVKEEISKSHSFLVQPGTLISGKTYEIKCLIVDNKNNINKTSSILNVNVLERGIELDTYTNHLRIGINQPIYLNAYFNDPDCTDGTLIFLWKCSSLSNTQCPNFDTNNATELILTNGISKSGRYTLSLDARIGNKTETSNSTIDVIEKQVPILDIENAITSTNPSDTIKISARINRLFIGCTLQWISVNNLTEYKFVNSSNNVPGNLNKIHKITVEDNEIIDELNSNNTAVIDKQYDLIIPSSKDGSWKGLEASSKYLFRLSASCSYTEDNNTSSNHVNEESIESFADIIVRTNFQPILKSLSVSPKTGQALRTTFTYYTEKPENCTSSLLYKFGYLDNKHNRVFLIKQYETTNALTLLPFYEEPISTIFEVCDSKNACNFQLGPKVIVKLPSNFTSAEISSLINNFNKSVYEQDYFSAFTLARMILQTSKNMTNNATFNVFHENIIKITKHELRHYLNASGESWIQSANNLLKNIKILDNEIHLPQDILNDILNLRDKISDTQTVFRNGNYRNEKRNKLVKLSQNFYTRKLLSSQQTVKNSEKKLKRIVNDVNIDEIKDYLEITELAIKRLSDFERVEAEKQKLIKKLEHYLPGICQMLYDNYKSNIQIELSSLIINIEKINLIRKYNDFISVPYEMNLEAKIQLGRTLAEKFKNQNDVCLGKLIFLDDYFHVPQYVYNIQLYKTLLDDFLDSNLNNFGIIIDMPIKSPVSGNQLFQCVLWENSNWNFSKCKTLEESATRVRCGCSSLGYFSLVPVERTTTTTLLSTTTTLKTSIAPIAQQFATVNYIFTTPIQLQDTKEQSPTEITPTKLSTITEQTANYKRNDEIVGNGDVNSAGVWSITLLSLGIFSVLLAFLVLFRRFQKSKAIQSFQTVEYAKYFDEHTLE